MAAFYFGPDTVYNEETGAEMSREELIAEGRKVRAEMAAEAAADRAEMAAQEENEEFYNRAMAIEDNDVLETPARSLANLVGEISGEDVNGMKSLTYRSWCEEILSDTTQAERDTYYRTGEMTGSLEEYASFYRR